MFTLTFSLTAADIECLKADLGRTLPEVKSSHRCEALARGFSFRTYAAFLAQSRLVGTISVTPNGAKFAQYLVAHHFEVQPSSFYLAAGRIAIRKAIETNPKLTMDGIGVGPPRRGSDGKRESAADHYARLIESRGILTSDRAIEEFFRSLAFLSQITPTKSIRPDTSSYRLKHLAEKYRCTYPEGQRLGPNYVSNGALIAAAIHSGFRFKTYTDSWGYDSLNVNFNMSKKALDDLDCELRPDGARAQDRQRRFQLPT